MSALPLGLSVPHAGLEVPDYVASYCILPPEEVVRDGDEGAAEVYDLAPSVERHVTARVARAIVDLNRATDDRRKDGVVKTHTCWDVPVYATFPPAEIIDRLLEEYHRPYHARLSAFAGAVKLGVDCHTMAAHGPPIAPDPGQRRPLICLGDGEGACPGPWIEALRECFARYFGADEVTVNRPFSGGYITRHHGREMPWVQLEMSRTPEIDNAEKRRRTLAALTDWCRLSLPGSNRGLPR